ncbi:MAG: hypothetical protein Q4G04_00355 [bacterium]|nr:hypothetical protein [bacterium]
MNKKNIYLVSLLTLLTLMVILPKQVNAGAGDLIYEIEELSMEGNNIVFEGWAFIHKYDNCSPQIQIIVVENDIELDYVNAINQGYNGGVDKRNFFDKMLEKENGEAYIYYDVGFKATIDATKYQGKDIEFKIRINDNRTGTYQGCNSQGDDYDDLKGETKAYTTSRAEGEAGADIGGFKEADIGVYSINNKISSGITVNGLKDKVKMTASNAHLRYLNSNVLLRLQLGLSWQYSRSENSIYYYMAEGKKVEATTTSPAAYLLAYKTTNLALNASVSTTTCGNGTGDLRFCQSTAYYCYSGEITKACSGGRMYVEPYEKPTGITLNQCNGSEYGCAYAYGSYFQTIPEEGSTSIYIPPGLKDCPNDASTDNNSTTKDVSCSSTDFCAFYNDEVEITNKLKFNKMDASGNITATNVKNQYRPYNSSGTGKVSNTNVVCSTDSIKQKCNITRYESGKVNFHSLYQKNINTQKSETESDISELTTITAGTGFEFGFDYDYKTSYTFNSEAMPSCPAAQRSYKSQDHVCLEVESIKEVVTSGTTYNKSIAENRINSETTFRTQTIRNETKTGYAEYVSYGKRFKGCTDISANKEINAPICNTCNCTEFRSTTSSISCGTKTTTYYRYECPNSNQTGITTSTTTIATKPEYEYTTTFRIWQPYTCYKCTGYDYTLAPNNCDSNNNNSITGNPEAISRCIEATTDTAIEKINNSKANVITVDVNSGTDTNKYNDDASWKLEPTSTEKIGYKKDGITNQNLWLPGDENQLNFKYVYTLPQSYIDRTTSNISYIVQNTKQYFSGGAKIYTPLTWTKDTFEVKAELKNLSASHSNSSNEISWNSTRIWNVNYSCSVNVEQKFYEEKEEKIIDYNFEYAPITTDITSTFNNDQFSSAPTNWSDWWEDTSNQNRIANTYESKLKKLEYSVKITDASKVLAYNRNKNNNYLTFDMDNNGFLSTFLNEKNGIAIERFTSIVRTDPLYSLGCGLSNNTLIGCS